MPSKESKHFKEIKEKKVFRTMSLERFLELRKIHKATDLYSTLRQGKDEGAKIFEVVSLSKEAKIILTGPEIQIKDEGSEFESLALLHKVSREIIDTLCQ